MKSTSLSFGSENWCSCDAQVPVRAGGYGTKLADVVKV